MTDLHTDWFSARTDRPPASAAAEVRLRPKADRRDHASRDGLLARVEAEYLEMPGLRLTLVQAMRLFNVRADICARVLATLVERSVLTQRNGGYALPSADV